MIDTTTRNMLAAPLVQRRDDYRLDIPAEDEAMCTFTFARKFEQQSYAVTLEVRDISAGGLSVADYNRQLVDVEEFTIESCALQLPNHPKPVYVHLKVLRTQQDSLASRHAVTWVSCQFINLSDASSVVIRRYVSALERRQNARQRGLD